MLGEFREIGEIREAIKERSRENAVRLYYRVTVASSMRNGYRVAPPGLPKMASRERVESREGLGGLVASREGLPKKEVKAEGSERVSERVPGLFHTPPLRRKGYMQRPVDAQLFV